MENSEGTISLRKNAFCRMLFLKAATLCQRIALGNHTSKARQSVLYSQSVCPRMSCAHAASSTRPTRNESQQNPHLSRYSQAPHARLTLGTHIPNRCFLSGQGLRSRVLALLLFRPVPKERTHASQPQCFDSRTPSCETYDMRTLKSLVIAALLVVLPMPVLAAPQRLANPAFPPAPPAGQAISVKDTMYGVLRIHRTLRGMQENREVLKHELDRAYRGFGPRVDVNASGGFGILSDSTTRRNDSDTGLFPPRGATIPTQASFRP